MVPESRGVWQKSWPCKGERWTQTQTQTNVHHIILCLEHKYKSDTVWVQNKALNIPWVIFWTLTIYVNTSSSITTWSNTHPKSVNTKNLTCGPSVRKDLMNQGVEMKYKLVTERDWNWVLDTALRVKVVTKKTNVEILKTVIAVQDSKTTSRSILFSKRGGTDCVGK